MLVLAWRLPPDSRPGRASDTSGPLRSLQGRARSLRPHNSSYVTALSIAYAGYSALLRGAVPRWPDAQERRYGAVWGSVARDMTGRRTVVYAGAAVRSLHTWLHLLAP